MDTKLEKALINYYGENWKEKTIVIMDFDYDWVIFEDTNTLVNPEDAACYVVPRVGLPFKLGRWDTVDENGIANYYDIIFKNLGNSGLAIAKLLSEKLNRRSVDILKNIKSSSGSLDRVYIRAPLRLKKELEDLGAIVVFQRCDNRGGYF